MKQKIILAVAILLGVLAALMTNSYISAKEKEVQQEKARLAQHYRPVDVVVVATDLPAGTKLQASDLRALAVPENALSSQTIRVSPNIGLRLTGRTLLSSVQARRPLQWSDIEGGAPEELGLASMIRSGMRALSVSVSSAASVSNMVRPTDRVDVLGTFTLPSKTAVGESEMITLTILQDVLVLATGQDTSSTYREGRQSYSLVTLELSPQEAEVITFAEQLRGRLTLALRNPTDLSNVKDLKQINLEEIRSSLEEMNENRQKHTKATRR